MLRRPIESALAACVAVTPQPGDLRAAGPAGHLDRVEDHLGAHVRSDPPAHDHPGVDVGDEADVGDPGPGRHVGQVGDPQLVRAGGGEVAAHQVWVTGRGRVGLGGADPLGASGPFDALGAHQPGDLVPAHLPAGPDRGLPELAGPVDAVVVLPELAQHRSQHAVAHLPGRGWSGLGRVVRARRHLQHAADGLDAELVAVRVDERDYFLCWRSSSAPKKLAARLRISLARRSSRFSCSSSRIRAFSLEVTPGARPSSMSA